MTNPIRLKLLLGLLVLTLNGAFPVYAQQLEPRRWGHLPMGSQFLGIGYVFTDGEIFTDPVLRIEDAEVELNSLGARYVYNFGLAGRSARFDVNLPYQKGSWQGNLDGVFSTTKREGLSDPRLRLSVLLHGAPALSGKAFSEFRDAHPINTVVGTAVSLNLPLGEYDQDRLINLGGNRLIVRPELGVLHTRNKWSYELTSSLSLFQDNDSFWPGNSKREQDPLLLVQGHVVYNFRPGLWTSVSGGYGFGGETTVDGIAKKDKHDNFFWAISLGVPLSPSQGVKLAYSGARTNNLIGIDSDNLSLAWSVLF